MAEAAAPSAEFAEVSGDIPSQNLATALGVFARKTGLHVIYVSTVVRDLKSHTVAAGLGAAEALARLLEGTGLRFEFLTPHSVRILAARTPSSQTPGAVDESQHYIPEVMVTGSRIPVGVVSVASPMQVVTVQDILLAGHTDASDVIAALPQMITTAGTDFGNHSTPNADAGGITTADLRGLRPQRTVVLLNGRRLGLGDSNTNNPSPAPNLDQIPLALVDRVEVLTGGASATYGADAVAGVVNFILKDNVQGVQIDAQYGVAQHHQHNSYVEGLETAAHLVAPTGTVFDGARRDVSILAGSAFHDGDGQITGYFVYHDQDAVPGSARDFSDCPAFRDNAVDACEGNLNSNLFVPNGFEHPYAVVGSQFVPWPARGSVPPPFFNYAPYLYAQRKDRRYQAGVLSHLELNPSARPYLEFTSMYDETRTGIAPTGLFIAENRGTADGGYLVNCSNPLLSAQEAAILCTPAQIAADRIHPGSVGADVLIGRRNIEGSGRLSSYEHRSYRVVGGVQGEFSDDWNYNAYALYDHTALYQGYYNYLSTAAINNALQVTTGPSGRPVCISGGPCVAYDIFSSGAVTAQQP
ncbi:MAG: TonB-dependent receptor plug domain-containing protein, partial [Sinobacteraceae bacterium]|nr:TonB-dependent receptor plug domain-containing protein [Nevskiaceae bacterium]